MKLFIGAGLMAILLAIAIGICSFFGIINAQAIMNPQQAYKSVRVAIGHEQQREMVVVHPHDGCRSPAALKLEWSFANQPDSWTTDNYRMHKGRVSLWVANEDYGLEMNGSWPYGGACRAVVWKAIEKWQARHGETLADDATE